MFFLLSPASSLSPFGLPLVRFLQTLFPSAPATFPCPYMQDCTLQLLELAAQISSIPELPNNLTVLLIFFVAIGAFREEVLLTESIPNFF